MKALNKLNEMPDRWRGAVMPAHASMLSGTNHKGDANMKKHLRVVSVMAVCIAGFMTQVAAFGQTTNSVWDLSTIATFTAGKIKVVETNAATAVFLSDGTASLIHGTNEYSGTYTNTTKQLTLTLGTGGLAALKADATDLIDSAIDNTNIIITVKSVKFSNKIKLTSAGVPESTKATISGSGSETGLVKGKTKTVSKSFKLTLLYTDWTLASGSDF